MGCGILLLWLEEKWKKKELNGFSDNQTIQRSVISLSQKFPPAWCCV